MITLTGTNFVSGSTDFNAQPCRPGRRLLSTQLTAVITPLLDLTTVVG